MQVVVECQVYYYEQQGEFYILVGDYGVFVYWVVFD